MRNKILSFFTGFIVASILMLSVGASANDLYKNISVIFNDIKLVINGDEKAVDNIVYNGSTYVKLRDLSYLFNKDVEWDTNTKTAYIDEKGILKLTKTTPSNLQEAYFPMNGFLSLSFSENMSDKVDISKVSIESETGEKVTLGKIQIGYEGPNVIFLIPKDRTDFKPGTTYTISVSKNTFESMSGKKYNRDIKVKFKISETILSGTINGWKAGSMVTLYNKETNETYKNTLGTNGLMTFINITGGNYKLTAIDQSGLKYEKDLYIESGMMNKISLN